MKIKVTNRKSAQLKHFWFTNIGIYSTYYREINQKLANYRVITLNMSILVEPTFTYLTHLKKNISMSLVLSDRKSQPYLSSDIFIKDVVVSKAAQ